MLKLYDPFEAIMAERMFFTHAPALRYYASELMEQLGCNTDDDMADALTRAMQACRAMSIPININFRQVYRYDDEKVIVDYRLSALGGFLVVLNANPCHPAVARAQLYTLMRNH